LPKVDCRVQEHLSYKSDTPPLDHCGH